MKTPAIWTELLKNGNWADASTALRQEIESQPHNPLLHYNLAICLLESEEFQEAEKHLRETIVRDPLFTKAWYALAELFLATGRKQEAFKAFSEILLIQPYRPEALLSEEKLEALRTEFANMS